MRKVYVILDGPIAHQSGRFVEVEGEDGRSVTVESCPDARESDAGRYWRLGPFFIEGDGSDLKADEPVR